MGHALYVIKDADGNLHLVCGPCGLEIEDLVQEEED